MLLVVSGVLGSAGALAEAAPVSVVRVTELPMQEDLPLVGTVIARRTSRISAQVEGFVDELFVEEGDEVVEDQPLFHLDQVLAEIAVDRAEAELAEAEARLRDVERKLREAETLRLKQAIPETTFESARIDVQAGEAGVQRLTADLARQRELLERHTIRAPFAGVIVGKLAEVGQWIRTDTTVFALAEIATLRIEVPVPQVEFSRIDVGETALLQFDALPGELFEGQVARKIPAGRDAVRTFPVWIDFPNHARMIAPGMSARVRMNLADPGTLSIVVPNDSLVRRSSGETVVWRLEEQDSSYVAVPVPVRTGRVNAEFTEIIGAGLTPGEWVVVRGNETLRPRQSVRIANRLARDS